MTRWAAFAGLTLAILVLLLLLARASQSAVSSATSSASSSAGSDRPVDGTLTEHRWLDRLHDGADHLDVTGAAEPAAGTPGNPLQPDGALSTTALLANVAVSHGLFAAILVGGIWLTDVPLAALGVTTDPLSTGALAVAVGLAVGLAIALANTVAAGLADRFQSDPSEALRDLLAPETAHGWLVLLGLVLPVIAGFEELLFRAALVGAFSVGFGLSPWLLAVLSSIAFAAGHGAQGPVGVVVTGMLGFTLAAAFVLTNSLLVVVIAHYVVNAVEFAVIEGLDWEPFE